MSFIEKYIENPIGRSGLISFLIATVVFLLTWLIPFAPYTNGAWYLFLYKDIKIPVEDRYNLLLVIVDVLLLLVFYFYLTVSLGNFAEVRNRLPGWSELVPSVIITGFMAWFQPLFGINGALVGTDKDTGFNHFTPDMHLSVFWATVVGIILITLYFMNSGPKE